MFKLKLTAFFVFAGLSVHANAQSTEDLLPQLTPSTTASPYSLFQYGALTGSGNTISASYVPVILANGSTLYKNVTVTFAVDSSGNLTVASATAVPAPTLLVSSFEAGSYVGPSNESNFAITVSGPGVAAGGATEWSVTTPSTASSQTFPNNATWYVGPLSSSPIAARLKAAGITSTAWSYGVETASCGCNSWSENTLIGVSQTGNAITFVSFTVNGTDYSTPQNIITYTLKQ